MNQPHRKRYDYDRPDLPLRLLLTATKAVLNSPPGKCLYRSIKTRLQADHRPWFDVTEIPLTIRNLAPEFTNYRLVQISDFHFGTWLNLSLLDEAIQQINFLQPDLVAITGDFVTHDPDIHYPLLVQALSRLKSKDGVVAVLGNHDHWSDPIAVRKILQDAQIDELNNRHVSLQRGNHLLHIAGVDDYVEHLDNLPKVISQLPELEPAILLAHEPDYALISSKTGRFALQLSGHTHGGQVRLPGIGAMILPQYGKKFPCGMYQVGSMALYTNRGLGMAELDIRYNCSAEITVFILQSLA